MSDPLVGFRAALAGAEAGARLPVLVGDTPAGTEWRAVMLPATAEARAAVAFEAVDQVGNTVRSLHIDLELLKLLARVGSLLADSEPIDLNSPALVGLRLGGDSA